MCFEPAVSGHNPHRPIHDCGRVEALSLDPVDSISIVTLVDNTIGILSADSTLARLPRLPTEPVVLVGNDHRKVPGHADGRARALDPRDDYQGRS